MLINHALRAHFNFLKLHFYFKVSFADRIQANTQLTHEKNTCLSYTYCMQIIKILLHLFFMPLPFLHNLYQFMLTYILAHT